MNHDRSRSRSNSSDRDSYERSSKIENEKIDRSLRSRSNSSDRDSYERSSKLENERTDRSPRSRSNSSDQDSYERSLKLENERTDRSPRAPSFRVSRGKKIYVKNIRNDATYSEIKDKFSTVGVVTFVRMLKDEKNRFKGSAIITFKEADMVEKAIQTMNRKKFKGQKLLVKEGTSRRANQQRRARRREDQEKDRVRSLFLERELQKCSDGPSFDKSSTFPFLFTDVPECYSPPLVGMDATPNFKGEIDGKRMKKNFGRVSLPKIITLASKAASYSTSNNNTYGLSLTLLNSLNIDLPLIAKVFVANLVKTVNELELSDVFCLAGKILNISLFRNRQGKCRGFAIVEYEHPLEAVQAIAMFHNQSYKDRLLTVRMGNSDRKKDTKDHIEREKDSKTRLPPGLKSVGMGLFIDGKPLNEIKNGFPIKDVQSLAAVNPVSGINTINPINQTNSALESMNTSLINQIAPGIGGLVGPMTSRMGVNPTGSLTESLSASGVRMNMGRDVSQSSSSKGVGTPGNIIQVLNLPLNYTAESLRKLCWHYGDVRLVEMRPQGTGIVKFKSEADAQWAVEMLDRQPFEEKMLSASML